MQQEIKWPSKYLANDWAQELKNIFHIQNREHFILIVWARIEKRKNFLNCKLTKIPGKKKMFFLRFSAHYEILFYDLFQQKRLRQKEINGKSKTRTPEQFFNFKPSAKKSLVIMNKYIAYRLYWKQKNNSLQKCLEV